MDRFESSYPGLVGPLRNIIPTCRFVLESGRKVALDAFLPGLGPAQPISVERCRDLSLK